MQLIRAFLYAREMTGDWGCRVFTDYASLMAAAKSVVQKPGESAVIHAGFSRPTTAKIGELGNRWPNRILFSEAALLTFPEKIRTTSVAVGSVEGHSFRSALRDQLDDSPSMPSVEASLGELGGPTVGTRVGASVLEDQTGWVATLIARSPEYRQPLSASAIVDEVSYTANEGRLTPEIRKSLAFERFFFLAGELPQPGIMLDNLGALPPWLLKTKLTDLDLSVRQRNVFAAHAIDKVEDLLRFGSSEKLSRLPNLGRTSLFGIGTLLSDAISKDAYRFIRSDNQKRDLLDSASSDFDSHADSFAPVDDRPHVGPADGSLIHDEVKGSDALNRTPKSIEDCFMEAAKPLDEKLRGVWAALMGFKCKRHTLQEIGDIVGISRERVRQLEVKIYRRVKALECFDFLCSKLDQLFEGAHSPLYLAGLDALDPWFKGVADIEDPIREVFDHVLDKRFSILQIDGLSIVARIHQKEWDSAVQTGKALLERLAASPNSEETAKFQVESLLPPFSSELAGAFWDEVSQFAVWSLGANGHRALVGYGKSAEAVVQAVLASSKTPLHFEEIARLAAQLSGRSHDVRRVHNAAARVGLLFGRGTYGLASHFPLTPDESQLLLTEVEETFSGEESSRQWHTSEIFEELIGRGIDFGGRLSKYVVDIALGRSDKFVSFGRMVWGVKNVWETASVAHRLDLRQAVLSLLEAAGHPLTIAEIKHCLSEDRGFNEHFQIQPGGDLVRLGIGRWGLLGRDVQPELISEKLVELRRLLEARQEGIHVSELPALLYLRSEEDANALMSLCDAEGIRRDRGQHVFLEAWGESRRVTLSDAVKIAVSRLSAKGGTVEEIHSAVVKLAKRDIPKISVSYALRSSDRARWDGITNRWYFDVVSNGDLDDGDVVDQ